VTALLFLAGDDGELSWKPSAVVVSCAGLCSSCSPLCLQLMGREKGGRFSCSPHCRDGGLQLGCSAFVSQQNRLLQRLGIQDNRCNEQIYQNQQQQELLFTAQGSEVPHGVEMEVWHRAPLLLLAWLSSAAFLCLEPMNSRASRAEPRCLHGDEDGHGGGDEHGDGRWAWRCSMPIISFVLHSVLSKPLPAQHPRCTVTPVLGTHHPHWGVSQGCVAISCLSNAQRCSLTPLLAGWGDRAHARALWVL